MDDDGRLAKVPELLTTHWAIEIADSEDHDSFATALSRADALVSMASAYLSGNAWQTRNTSDDYVVTVHVDQSALAHGNGRASLPIESVK